MSPDLDIMALVLLAVSAAACSIAASAAAVSGGGGPASALLLAPPPLAAAPLTMDAVALAPGSRWFERRARNEAYLVGFNMSDLLCEYTAAANLTGTFAAPTCKMLEGVQYFGHYTGHWLSATAQLCNATRGASPTCAANAEGVARLAQAQAAWTALAPAHAEYAPGGFLFSYSYWPAFSGLFQGASCDVVCVPWYIFHKMLAGMLDAHALTGNAQALQVALGMAAWAKAAAERVLAAGGQAQWQASLGIEWGAMNDALFSLAAATGDAQWVDAAYYFNHFAWTAPLVVGVDNLNGNHANTHIPEVVGDARGYEVTGNATKLAIVQNFFGIVTSAHSFPTGGSSDGEMWGAAHLAGDYLNDRTEESCTQYNILKVSRHLFAWTANSSLFDFYERGLLNGLIGNQALTGPFAPPAAPGFQYMLPLGGAGLTRPLASADSWLACCWGTLSETFAKLSDSVYWQDAAATGGGSGGSDDVLFVNLFVASTASWRAGAVVRQDSDFPYTALSTTTLTVDAAGSEPTFTLAIRVPFWASGPSNIVTLNGSPVAQPIVPGTFLRISRTWAAGDVVAVLFPPQFRFENVDDARAIWKGVGAVFFGPVMLATIGVSAGSDMLPLNSTAPADLARVFARTAPPPPPADYADLSFTASTACGAAVVKPLMDVAAGEAYATIFHTAPFGGAVVAYPATSVSGADAASLVPLGGAAVVPEGGAGEFVVRSGEPKSSTSVAFFSHIVADAAGAHALASVAFSYKYSSGFSISSGAAANFSLVALGVDSCADGPGPVVAVLYASPPLADFPFSACDDYTPQEPGGYLAGGDDVLSGQMTLAQAFANCSALPSCLAITFNGPLAPAPGETVLAYLKSAVNFVEAPGWQTFVSSRVSSDPPSPQHAHAHENAHAHAHANAHSHSHSHLRAHAHGAGRRHREDSPHARGVASGAPRDPASCFSPPVPVRVSGLALDADSGLQLALLFDNNDRNVRLALPLNVEISWS